MKQTVKLTIGHGVLDDIELPSIIYKYRTWSDNFHKRFITEREVFMASARSFEDDLDCRNPTRFDLLTNRQIYDYYDWSSKEENPNFTRQQHRKFARSWAKKSLIKDIKSVEKWKADTLEEYYDHDGILSLTENWNNDEMWKKYSDDGKGFCIGYNTREMFKYLGGGGPVEYVDELPIILPEPFMQFAEALRNRVYHKLKKWTFEDEYRTKMFWPHVATIQDRQIQLPKEAFNKIILGNNISENDKAELIKNVTSHIGDIEITERKKNVI
jgi:hypothetical protein